jgi:hypothetical protein
MLCLINKIEEAYDSVYIFEDLFKKCDKNTLRIIQLQIIFFSKTNHMMSYRFPNSLNFYIAVMSLRSIKQ